MHPFPIFFPSTFESSFNFQLINGFAVAKALAESIIKNCE
jgi:hypothetical protein